MLYCHLFYLRIFNRVLWSSRMRSLQNILAVWFCQTISCVLIVFVFEGWNLLGIFCWNCNWFFSLASPASSEKFPWFCVSVLQGKWYNNNILAVETQLLIYFNRINCQLWSCMCVCDKYIGHNFIFQCFSGLELIVYVVCLCEVIHLLFLAIFTQLHV